MNQPSVIETIVSQHAEEAAFLWLLRDTAIYAPHYSLNELAELDDRIEAHIDGLRIAGDAGWELCEQALAYEEAGEVFAATVLAFETSDNGRTGKAVEIGCLNQETFGGFISALGWIPYSKVESWIQRLLGSKHHQFRHIGLTACAIHRQDPGDALTAALDATDPLLQARALRTVGELKRIDQLPRIRHYLRHDNETCRFWAAWSAAALKEPRGIDILRQHIESKTAFHERALKMALRAMDPLQGVNWIRNLYQSPEHARTVITGAGIIGDPVSIPFLIQQMEKPELARVAGESFSMIIGVDIAYEDLEGEQPEGFEAGPTEDPADNNVAMDTDEDLPWPDPALISTWWDQHRDQFRAGTRYLLGKPIDKDQAMQVLINGQQRQRQAAALELALWGLNTPLFETRAPGFRQQRLLLNPEN